MLDLLITTLEMMGLTFVIGFFVAFIIKMIAVAADSFDFYSSHQKELLRLRRLRKLRQKVELMIRDIPMDNVIDIAFDILVAILQRLRVPVEEVVIYRNIA